MEVFLKNKSPKKTVVWPHNERIEGCSECFWFWGTNAHLIFESGVKASKQIDFPKTKNSQIMAIVGMEAIFGGCKGLHEFYQTIYDNKQHSVLFQGALERF
ncbi:MAG: hypothetical protein Ct9H300mP21_02620 [Pseudomonadota bacterium]|nr:MAG: hypothetical protein Ct9H300mP21_02620 [Pseudomonadota bacterium]